MRHLSSLAFTLAFGVIVSCASSEEATPGDESDIKTKCQATLTYWQKDAYMDVGGRNLPFWPPHTTTSLSVTCGQTVVGKKDMGNHGSVPGMMGTDNKPLLAVVKTETVTGTKATMLSLLETYGECECAPAKFLGLNNLNTPEIQQLIGELATVIETKVPCGGKEKDLANALRTNNIDQAMAIAKTCSWPGGNAALALSEALAKVAENNRQNFSDYHVCNNDASLQGDLVKSFRSKGRVTKCDQASALCRGPNWFYAP